MKTLRDMIAQLPPDSQKRIEEMTKTLIAEEKMLRESNEARSQLDEAELAEITAAELEYQQNDGMEAGQFFRSLRKERGWE